MFEIKPLIFKSEKDYLNYFRSLMLEDGWYNFFVIFSNDNSLPSPFFHLALTSVYYSEQKCVTEVWNLDITYDESSTNSDVMTYYCNDEPASAEEFFAELNKTNPEHLKWLLFNPEWYLLVN